MSIITLLLTVDKLIHYVNLDGRVNAFYSTPTIFTNALKATNYTFSVKVGTVRYHPVSVVCCLLSLCLLSVVLVSVVIVSVVLVSVV